MSPVMVKRGKNPWLPINCIQKQTCPLCLVFVQEKQIFKHTCKHTLPNILCSCCSLVTLNQIYIFAHCHARSDTLIIPAFTLQRTCIPQKHSSKKGRRGKKIHTVLPMHIHSFEHFILFKCNSITTEMNSFSIAVSKRFFLAHFKAICLLCCLLTLSVVIKGAHWNLWFNYTGLVMKRRPGWADMLNKNKFHMGLLNLLLHGGCDRSNHSGVCVCVIVFICSHVCICVCVYLCIALQDSHSSSMWSVSGWEWNWKKKNLDELQSIGVGSLYWSPSMLKPAVLHEEHSVSLPCLHQLRHGWIYCKCLLLFFLHTCKKDNGACSPTSSIRVCLCVSWFCACTVNGE